MHPKFSTLKAPFQDKSRTKLPENTELPTTKKGSVLVSFWSRESSLHSHSHMVLCPDYFLRPLKTRIAATRTITTTIAAMATRNVVLLEPVVLVDVV
jgi:hypothetical protein